MQPQQPNQPPVQYPPQPAPGPNGHGGQNNYDFILNPAAAPKKSPFNFGGGLVPGKLIAILGGVFLLVIILAVVVNMSGGGTDKADMLAVAQDQTELLRLIEVGDTNVKSQALQNFNATAAASTTSDQLAFLEYMGNNDLKVNSKDLALGYDSAVDTQLNNALSAGTFETAYKEVMDKELAQYQTDLTAAYKTSGPKGKAVLEAQFNNAKLLRAQLNS